MENGFSYKIGLLVQWHVEEALNLCIECANHQRMEEQNAKEKQF